MVLGLTPLFPACVKQIKRHVETCCVLLERVTWQPKPWTRP